MKALPWIIASVAVSAAVYVFLNPPAPAYSTGSPDVEDAAAKTSAWGTKQRVKGTGGSLLGKAKEGVGNVTGNDSLADEGVVDQAVGTVKDAAGQVADAVGDTLHDLNKG